MYGPYGAYTPRGAMLGSGGVSDGYEVGSKRQRMMDTNAYFAVSSGAAPIPYRQIYPYGSSSSSSYHPTAFPVVRLRGMPFNCTDMDVYKFFIGLDIVDVLMVNKNGKFSGEAFVVFATPMHAEVALQKDHQNMGRRYVEVFKCKKQDYYNAVASEVNSEAFYETERGFSPPPPPINRAKRSVDKENLDYSEVLKLRGLPFSVLRSDILEFFREFNVAENKVHIVCRPDGKTTGEAFVEFVSVEEAKRAMCKDKMTIGSRYVELFPATVDEARRAESRSRH